MSLHDLRMAISRLKSATAICRKSLLGFSTLTATGCTPLRSAL